MLVGYVRNSSDDRDIDAQSELLRAHGCELLFKDTLRSVRGEQPALSQALEHLSEGDILVIWRLDRLGLRLNKFLKLMTALRERHIGLRSLVEAIDTERTSAPDFFVVTAALEQMERNLRREQAMPGLDAARTQGQTGGRPKSIDPETFAKALDLYGTQKDTVESICNRLGIARRTFYRYRARHEA